MDFLAVTGELATMRSKSSGRILREQSICPEVALIGKPPLVTGFGATVASNRGLTSTFSKRQSALRWLRALVRSRAHNPWLVALLRGDVSRSARWLRSSQRSSSAEPASREKQDDGSQTPTPARSACACHRFWDDSRLSFRTVPSEDIVPLPGPRSSAQHRSTGLGGIRRRAMNPETRVPCARVRQAI
jgi:hypothetical protein